MNKPSARELAMDILTKVEQQQAYSNLLLNQTLQKHRLERLDIGLTTELVYGTIQRRNTIDFFLNQFAAKGIKRFEPWVRNLLRLSFYQLYYLERIPEHAIVNEAVSIAKRKGHKGISGLVNGMLRNIIRSKDQLTLPAELSPIQRIALQHSHPEWMVARWIDQFGERTAEAICEANNVPAHDSVRVNRIRGSREHLLQRMRAHDVQAEASPLSSDGIIVHQHGNMAFSEWFEQGELSIQDESSMLVAAMVDPKPGMKVLDCCAAPGGKTTHLAEIMADTGQIWANDVHPHKQQLIEEQASRLGLNCIETMVCDAQQLGNEFSHGSFDRILVDAPCSGFGVMRRKPDLKWSKQEKDISRLPHIQLGILNAVAPLLHPTGLLVYSTCTLESAENERVVDTFLSQHPEYILDEALASHVAPEVAKRIVKADGMIRILPHDYHSDGFFIARFKRKAGK